MEFFLTLTEGLRVQMGAAFTEQTIQTFLDLFTRSFPYIITPFYFPFNSTLLIDFLWFAFCIGYLGVKGASSCAVKAEENYRTKASHTLSNGVHYPMAYTIQWRTLSNGIFSLTDKLILNCINFWSCLISQNVFHLLVGVEAGSFVRLEL